MVKPTRNDPDRAQQQPKAPVGLVLAAGLGSRLQTNDGTTVLKPLVPVGGVPLIHRTLRSLELAGCETVVIVVGFEADELCRQISSTHRGGTKIEFVTNERYRLANGVSVLCGRGHVGDRFVLTMSDHIIGDELMVAARDHVPPKDGVTLLVDYKLDSIFDMDDATKVLAREGRIEAIGKQLTEFNCVDTGVFVCTPGLMAELEAVLAKKGDASLSDGISALARAGRMRALDIGDGYWQDVDTPEMLAQAEAVLARRPS